MTIRAGVSNLDDVVKKLQDSREWIEAMQYSPDGTKLAVGSHDNNIYVYDAQTYNLLYKCVGCTSFIVSVDWSADN